ncbi:MAG: hypothetical protein GC154_19715 [bacterium]|nr:hypothetical protein [bacterium]
MSPAAAVVIVFFATTAFIFCLFMALMGFAKSESRLVERRLDKLDKAAKSAAFQKQALELLKQQKDSEKYPIFSRFPPLMNLPLLFEQAGLPNGVQPWFIGTVFWTLIGGAAVWFITHNLLYALGGMLFMAALRYMGILMRRSKRLKRFEENFAQSLEIVSRSLRAGHPFSMGLYMVSTETPAPVSTEFGQIFHEVQMGLPLEDSLAALAARVPILDVRFFILTVMIHQQTGGDLAEVLDGLAGVIRDRFKIQGQVKALTAEGRLSGWVLSALPVFVFFVILLMNPDYIKVLITTELGRKMMYFAAGMQVVGMLLIRKIVNIRI